MITNRTARSNRSNRSALAVWATVIAAFALVFAVVSPAAAAETDDIYSGLNAARASAGAPALALAHNASLDAVALAWANQMATNNAMSHNPSTGSQIPAGWSGWGENVATGFATGAATNAGWTASPGHYANMVGDFTDVGIAFVTAGGTTWAVEVFAKYASTAAAVSSEVVTAAPATAPVVAPAAGPAPATSSTSAPVATIPVAENPTSENPASDNATAESPASKSPTSKTAAAATPTPRTLAAPVSSVSPATQPIVYVGLIAIPLAIALAVFLVLRARRKRGVVQGPAA